MGNQVLEIKVAIQIMKTPDDVFEAIINPSQMVKYFISESNGMMEEGKDITWRFPEFDNDVPIRVSKIEKDKYISFHWDMDDNELIVEMILDVYNGDNTVLTITEKSRKNDKAGINWLTGNTEGWANFLACLKAYLEYGINLRKGAFDFRGAEAE